MNRSMGLPTLAVVAVLAAGVAVAQGQQPRAGGQYEPLLEGANDLIGMSVMNNQGETLGSLEDIVLEPNLNYVSYGVLSRGGFVGIGENYFAIPWDTFQLSTNRDALVLNIPQQAFEQAQGFNKDRWPDRADQRWRMQMTGQQGWSPQQPQGEGAPQGRQEWREQQYQERQQWRQREDQPQARREQEQEQDEVYGRPERRQPQGWGGEQGPGRDAQQGGQHGMKEGFQLRRVSQLLGLDVQGFQQQEDLGELSDVVLDFQQGLVAYGIISLGGGENAPVPWSAIEIRPQQELALVQADRQMLKQFAFSGDALPNLSNPQYAQQLHSQFNREPYWEVLGFVGGPQMRMEQPMQMRMEQPMQQRRVEQPMEAPMEAPMQEPLTRHFDPQNITVISGTVQSIGMFEEPQLGIQGERLQVMTQDGQTVTVHAGPRQFLQQQGLNLRKNDEVQVRGSYAQIEGRTIFIASDIRTRDATVQLRNQQGMPLWRGMGQGMGRPQQQW